MTCSSGDPVPRDPRDVLREVPAPHEPAVDAATAGRIDELLEEVQAWLRRRIQYRARQTGLDPDDVAQELSVGLLRRSTQIEPHNPGIRTWLGRRVEWTVVDMLRRRGNEIPLAPEVLDSGRDRADPEPGPEERAGWIRLGVDELMAMGLPRNQAEVVAMRCQGEDLSLKDFARLVRRSHAAVRQDHSRGLHKIENLFGLTAREAEVFRTWRRFGPAAAAGELGMARADLDRTLEDVHKKIDRLFIEREGRP